MRSDATNPYVGLRPFDVDESILFFGRNDQTLELLQRLHHHHFVAVVGSSGSGKSSLLRAGLIPALKAGYLVDDSDQWLIAIMKPGQSPLYNLAESLLLQLNPGADGTAAASLVQKIKEEGADVLLNLITPARKERNINFFLLADQFEELFRFAMEQNDVAKKDEAIDFVNIILELSQQSLIPFYVVITMRSDFIGDCAQFYGLPEAMNQSQYLVPRLNRIQLKTVIEGPAKLYGGKLNPSLTSLLLNELGKVKDELPLLQHALMRIWDFEENVNKSGELDLEDYESIGGIEKALSNHADEALAGLSEQDVLLTKKIFQALTAIDENGRKIRRPVLLSQLMELTGATGEQLLNIIDLFIKDKRSFLVINKAGATGDKVIDISHESLIRQWKTLSDWVDEEGESVSNYIQLAEAAKLYKRKKKDFLTGSELQIALEWRDKFKPAGIWANRYKEGFEESIEYLNESEKERTVKLTIEKRRKRKYQYLIFAIMGLLFIVAIGGIWLTNKATNAEKNAKAQRDSADVAKRYAFTQKDSADINLKRAMISDSLSREDKKKADEQKVLAESSAREANNQKDIAQSNYLISEAKSILETDPTVALRLAGTALNIHYDKKNEEYAYKIYRENSFYKIIDSHIGFNSQIALSSDGKSILILDHDTLKKMNLNSKIIKTIRVLNHWSMYQISTLYADGKFILLNSIGKSHARTEDRLVEVYNFDGEPIQPSIHLNYSDCVNFSPYGDSIITYSPTGIKFWSLNGNPLSDEIKIQKNNCDVNSIELSPDGKFILTGGSPKDDNSSGIAQLWDMEGVLIHEFKGHLKAINCIKFAPDGKSILTGSEDKTVIWWNIDDQTKIQEFKGSTDIISVRFSEDSKSILTLSQDDTIRKWQLNSTVFREFEENGQSSVGNPISVSFSTDEKDVTIGFEDSSAKVWSILEGKLIKILKNYSNSKAEFLGKKIYNDSVQNFINSNEYYKLASSPDGQFICTVSNDHAILWNANGKRINEFDSYISSVAISSNGKLILIGSSENTAFLLHPDGTEIAEFIGNLYIDGITQGKNVQTVAFSSNGKYIFTATSYTQSFWKTDSTLIMEHNYDAFSEISKAIFSPSGTYVLLFDETHLLGLMEVPMPLDDFLKSDKIEPLSLKQKKQYGIK